MENGELKDGNGELKVEKFSIFRFLFPHVHFDFAQ